MMKSIRKTWRRVQLAVTALANDGSGVAAIEFAMIVPIMLVLFFGTVIFSSGVAVDRKVTLMARTFSDLVSQNISVSSVQLQNFFNADVAIMTPYDATVTSAVISELYIDPTTLIPKVEWSFAYNGANASPVAVAHTAGNTLSPNPVPGSLAVGGTYLIYSEIGYLFKPPGGNVMGLMSAGGIQLKDVAYTRPRQSACVIYPTPTSGALPACPN
jgi:Flp pilus assembly protein TadG